MAMGSWNGSREGIAVKCVRSLTVDDQKLADGQQRNWREGEGEGVVRAVYWDELCQLYIVTKVKFRDSYLALDSFGLNDSYRQRIYSKNN